MLRPGLAHVRELLQSNRLIRRHLEHRDRELALLGMVLSRLPDPLRAHCRDVVLSDGILTLFLDSPAWVTRARFMIEDLTRALEREGVAKVVAQVRVRSERDGMDALGPKPRGTVERQPNGGGRLTQQTRAHLLGAAEGMSDPALAEVFRRFANNHAPAAMTAAGDNRDSPESPGIVKTPAARSD